MINMNMINMNSIVPLVKGLFGIKQALPFPNLRRTAGRGWGGIGWDRLGASPIPASTLPYPSLKG